MPEAIDRPKPGPGPCDCCDGWHEERVRYRPWGEPELTICQDCKQDFVDSMPGPQAGHSTVEALVTGLLLLVAVGMWVWGVSVIEKWAETLHHPTRVERRAP